MCRDCGEIYAPEPYNFEGRYHATLARFDQKSLAPHSLNTIPWWVPFADVPDGITIRTEAVTEDIVPYRYVYKTLLMDRRFYMELYEYFDLAFGVKPESFRIYAYVTKADYVDDGLSQYYTAAVQSPTPPPWGTWMPSLEGLLA